MRIKEHDELRPKRLCNSFLSLPHFFLILADTLKTKVGDVVGCIFQVKCSVGGFLILKQIICSQIPTFHQEQLCHFVQDCGRIRSALSLPRSA
jgi:hypothetical protein